MIGLIIKARVLPALANAAYSRQNWAINPLGNIIFPGKVLPEVNITDLRAHIYPSWWGQGDLMPLYNIDRMNGKAINNALNVVTAAQMTTDFFKGTGPSNRAFYNNRVTDDMQSSYGIKLAKAAFWKKYRGASDISKASIQIAVKFGVPGLIKSGLHPIQQFVGGYQVNIWVSGNNLIFTVFNITSFRSLALDVGPQWERSQQQEMGNMYQEYMWSESINRP